MNRSFAHIT